MLTENENTRISKLLSYVLRHNPQEIGIALDENGWTGIDTLLQQLKAHGENITLAILKHIVETNAKKRFSFNADETKVRASQGHSVEVDLDYTEQQPPAILYHGTVEQFMPAILQEGLKKMRRHHVHLSPTTDAAIIVAKRRGKPVILTIDASGMFSDGFAFYVSANGVWLTDEVPARYIAQQP